MANITRLTIVKFIELLIVFVLLILHYNSYNAGETFNSMITMTAFGGYLIILIGLFSGVVMGTPVNRRVDLFFTLVGCLLFFVAGILNVSFFQSYSASTSFRSTGLAKGVIALIEGVLFLIDAVLTFRGES